MAGGVAFRSSNVDTPIVMLRESTQSSRMINRLFWSSLLLTFAVAVPCRVRAQASADPHCDSVIAAASVDSASAAMFISLQRTDGGPWFESDQIQLLSMLADVFTPPKPFRMNVFEGPAVSRTLRIRGGDTASVLRAPTVTGVYRIISDSVGAVKSVRIARASLMPGFDSAAVSAIEHAAMIKKLFKADGDSMRLELRLSTDSTPGARRLFRAYFPRLPVIDARPLASNPAPAFPDSDRAAGATSGEIVARFVVNRTGEPIGETIELIRGNSIGFAREALTVFGQQRFTPASIHGCSVAQQIDYPFVFVLPEDPSRPARH